MLPFSLFLSLKYLRPKRTFLSAVTVLSVLGVLLGVAVLVIVLSVMEGFDMMWREKILSFNAHITVYSYDRDAIRNDADSICTRLESLPGVSGAAPFLQSLMFVKAPNGEIKTPILRGIDPGREQKVGRLQNAVVDGEFDVSGGRVVVGADFARSLGLSVGDTLTAFSPASFADGAEIRLPRDWTVAGIFEVGMWEFDANYVLASIWDARSFCAGAGIEAFQVMTDDPYRADRAADAIRAAFPPGWQASTWMDLNRQLFAALRVEKNMMFFLLIFITIVAAFGITNTLITVTVQKTREIGILRSLGFSSSAVMRVFFWQGWIQGLLGIASGIGFGLLALRHRNDILHFLNDRCGMQLLPKELYHLAEIPSRTLPGDLLLIALSVIFVCTLAAVIPAWQAARLDPVKALRHD
jgi:lipoprotein-releasing system permease protein